MQKKLGFHLLALTLITALVGGTSYHARRQKDGLRNSVVQIKSLGRFGDNLMCFAHAVYFAKKNNLDLWYEPFIYSDELALSDALPQYSNSCACYFDTIIEHDQNSALASEEPNKNIKVLYRIPYFCESPIELAQPQSGISFKTAWDDQEFKQQLRALVKPKKQLTLIKPPRHKISIAVHVRTGGTFEKFPAATFKYKNGLLSYKIPYEQFYINQIKHASELLGHVPLYVFLFTDDNNPIGLMQRYKEQVNIPSIEFDCRREGNSHNANVLEDFFSLMEFDGLIRPESNYSIMAEKLGDFSLVISPADLQPGQTIQDGLVTLNKDKLFRQ